MNLNLKSIVVAGAIAAGLTLAAPVHASPLAGAAAGHVPADVKSHNATPVHRRHRRRGGVYIGTPYFSFGYGVPSYGYGYGYRPYYYGNRGYYRNRRYRNRYGYGGYRGYYPYGIDGGRAPYYAPRFGYGR